MATSKPRQQQPRCTVPFSLHLTILILGTIGFTLSVAMTALVFKYSDWYTRHGNDPGAKQSAVWILLSTIPIMGSGVQGLLIREGSFWFGCHVSVAMFNLLNLGVLIAACAFVGSTFWFGYALAVFVLELWVTCVRTCGKVANEGVDMTTELPVANRGGVQGYAVSGYAVNMPTVGQPFAPTYKVDPRPDAAAQSRASDRFEDVR